MRTASKHTAIQNVKDNKVYFNAILNPERFRVFFQRVASMKKNRKKVPFGNVIKKEKETPYFFIKFNMELA